MNKMPTNVTNYLILKQNNTASLVKQVEEYIDLGWEPLGGVAAVYDSRLDIIDIIQAMIKKTQ